MKQAVATYPAPRKDRVVQNGLWVAEFSRWSRDGFAADADLSNGSPA